MSVALVLMPYGSLSRPSLALSILRGLLREGGIDASIHYPNFDWCERIGLERFNLFSNKIPGKYLAGEWTFAEAAFRDAAPDPRMYLDMLAEYHEIVTRYRPELRIVGFERLRDHLLYARELAGTYIDETARKVVETGARIVGCTSTFQQHAAALALLRRVRELAPGIITMLGGANCEAEMGRATHRAFPWVDFVVSGEADGIIVDVCKKLLAEGRDAMNLPSGVIARAASGSAPRAVFRDLDRLPHNDFDEYFAALQRSPLARYVQPGLPVEFSRGCWWGAVHHCTFCGLNGSGMTYRSKSPERALEEIHDLERRYHLHTFEAVDNILDMGYYKRLLPTLAEAETKRSFFYEVKANMTRAQVELLHRAGVRWIQPGIESLSSAALQLMDKGVQGYQNVQLLRWAREFGIRLSWGILWGFPGEEDAWYDEMADVVPQLEHLQCPTGLLRLRIDRFSVYHSKAEQFGLRLRPLPAMAAVYPLSEAELMDLTYGFVDENQLPLDDALAARPGTARLRRAVQHWRRVFHAEMRPVLSVDDRDGVLRILDTRACARRMSHVLEGEDREVYLACESAPAVGRLPADVVARLVDARLVLLLDGRAIALGVSGDLPELPTMRDFPGGYVEESEVAAV